MRAHSCYSSWSSHFLPLLLLLLTSGVLSDDHRVVVYYQTTNAHGSYGDHVSLLPLVYDRRDISVTHVLLAAIHLNDSDGVHLNDFPPWDPLFDDVWTDVAILQSRGVIVTGMLGGAATGSFQRLDGDEDKFERYYGPLHDMIATYNLQGLDLDVEESMSLDGVIRLVDRLHADFGDDFVITLSPVASALQEGGGNLSGFNYFELEERRGDSISFYNAQFYSGFASATSTSDYEDIVDSGFPPEKVVMGLLTNSANGYGFVELNTTGSVIRELAAKYDDFGGVAGWEYFNSLPGNITDPAEWADWAADQMDVDFVLDTLSVKFRAKRAAHDVWHVVRRWGRKTWRLLS